MVGVQEQGEKRDETSREEDAFLSEQDEVEREAK